jgi:hypothetical protein
MNDDRIMSLFRRTRRNGRAGDCWALLPPRWVLLPGRCFALDTGQLVTSFLASLDHPWNGW